MKGVSAIHVYLNFFVNSSRVLKETNSLVKAGLIEKIIILALWKEGLKKVERLDKNRILIRVKNRVFPSKFPRFFRFVEVMIIMIFLIRRRRPDFLNIHQVLGLIILPFTKSALKKAKLIYDTHELETETIMSKGMVKRIQKWLERRFIDEMDHVFVVSPSIQNWYEKEYGLKGKVTTVMNCPYYRATMKTDHFRSKFDISEKTTIFLYQGAFFPGRGVDILLEAFKKLNDDSRFAIVFMGFGSLEQEVIKASEEYPNIYYQPAVPPEEVLDYTSSADFGIHLIQNTCLNHYFCLPNKTFEYLMAGIPSLVSNMLDLSSFIKDNAIGKVLGGNEAGQIVESILDQYGNSIDLNAIESAKHTYCWEEEEKKMISGYRKVLAV